jgi:zinc transporter ZupT
LLFAGGPAPLLAVWLLHTFDSTLPIALYIAAGAVLTLVATALLPDAGRAEVAREFETQVVEGIPETAKASRGRTAVTTAA